VAACRHLATAARVKNPVVCCGVFDLSPFPDYPEFFATYKMMNVKKHYIYNDSFTLNVLDLNQIELATDEDKAFGLDYFREQRVKVKLA